MLCVIVKIEYREKSHCNYSTVKVGVWKAAKGQVTEINSIMHVNCYVQFS